jgi:hypothetical protein
MKQKLVMGAAFAIAALISLRSAGQECDKGVTVYFSSGQKDLTALDKSRIDSLNKVFKNLNINYVEIAGHADQKGSDLFNYILAGKREKTVKKELVRGDFPKDAEVKEFNFGESRPRYLDEANMGRNRRVEIFFTRLEDGKLVLTKPSGSGIKIDKDFFSKCGLCGSFASITELKTKEEAAANNVPLKSSDGSEYSTAGLIRFHFECDKQRRECTTAEIRVASATSEEGMQLWEASGEGSEVNWTLRKEDVTYDNATHAYVTNAKICSDVWYSIGKEEPRANTIYVKLPKLQRQSDASLFITDEENTQPLEVHMNPEGFSTSCMECMDKLTLNDSGMADNGFVYYYAGELKPALVRTEKKNSYYELSLDSYKPIINYSDSVIILKIPKKYATKVKMYLPALDSTLAVRHYEKSDTKFRLKKPSHAFAITLTPQKNTTYRIDDDKLRLKYNKRKRLYFAKIKKKDLVQK